MTKQNQKVPQNNLSILPNTPYGNAINEAKVEFMRAAQGKNIDWDSESIFAIQACLNNEKLQKAAKANPMLMRMAMINVGAIGLTLNPAQQLAYLVPRDGKIIVDISYRGLIRIATDTGSIKVAKAELVYSGDKAFEYLGPFTAPIHKYDPFSTNRGELRGAYCMAKTIDDEILVEPLSLAELMKIREMSQVYQWARENNKACAHDQWSDEFHKKSAIKRASKTWPKTDRRLHEAIQYLNEEAGEGFIISNDMTSEIDVTPKTEPKKIEASTDETASVFARSLVEKLIVRGIECNAWQAAHDYAVQRITAENCPPGDLLWAHQKLTSAEAYNTPPTD